MTRRPAPRTAEKVAVAAVIVQETFAGAVDCAVEGRPHVWTLRGKWRRCRYCDARALVR